MSTVHEFEHELEPVQVAVRVDLQAKSLGPRCGPMDDVYRYGPMMSGLLFPPFRPHGHIHEQRLSWM